MIHNHLHQIMYEYTIRRTHVLIVKVTTFNKESNHRGAAEGRTCAFLVKCGYSMLDHVRSAYNHTLNLHERVYILRKFT